MDEVGAYDSFEWTLSPTSRLRDMTHVTMTVPQLSLVLVETSCGSDAYSML